MTTKEIGRLMGVDDSDIDKIIESGLSLGNINSLFGNSIVVDTLAAVFNELFFGKKSHECVTLF